MTASPSPAPIIPSCKRVPRPRRQQALVDKFRKNENSCLFGTLTLWQGVDVPGPSCSLVLIDRIPFPRP
ncbi:ATP-dependent helicase, partial [Bacteroides fragilis]|nr:ATP-dependent helicase [Bacteroides fragilis]